MSPINRTDNEQSGIKNALQRRAGDEVSGMKREQTTIRLPAELKEQLQQEADRRGDSFNETVIRLLRVGLQLDR